ncbi:AAA family ATPase [Jannaschia sp. KMU-145]|uniref:AAA family ATPase n=1 Tax=Jannaschia halovivens TaxID=3388667 RepID=UPI00396B37F6
MPSPTPTLHMLCGKIASGKSTLADTLAARPDTVRLSEDDWLHALYGDEMHSVVDYVRCAAKLRAAIGPHVADLLGAGLSVVLDVPANTIEARGWMRTILDASGSAHALHVMTTSDATCLARLRARNEEGDHPFAATEAQFHRMSAHYVPPGPEEGFDIVLHEPDQA